MGNHGCLVVAIWGREVVIDDLERIIEGQRRVLEKLGHCATVTIIRAKPTVGVSPEIRAAAART